MQGIHFKEITLPKRVSEEEKRNECPDCYQCQMCSIDRCRICRKGTHQACQSELATGFTYGQYLEWKEKRTPAVGKQPVIDASLCSDCETCMELCPTVFRRNRATGLIEVIDLPEYPEEEINKAIGYCPEDCISWEATG